VEYRRRFRQEAERAARANDAHVAAIYDVFEERGEVFLVMEYVEGQTLRARLHQQIKQPLTLEEFFSTAKEAAEGLAEAHERGIVHCDVKPENIMLTTSGHVKILDFGVAKQLPRPDQSSTIDRSGSTGGTPAYMAPEVLMQRAPDGRADIFSLGVVFYEVLSGRHPFLAENFFVTTDRIRNETPLPLRSQNAEVPEELETVVNRCLAKDPAVRYNNARELLEDLRAAHGELRHDTPHIILPVHQSPQPRRWLATLAALVLIATATWGAYKLWRYYHPPFRERGQALIADFAGVGQDSIPGQEVREGLSIVLGQSPYVNVYPRQQAFDALKRMKRQDVTRIDEPLGLEICRRENLDVLLAGSSEKVGQAFQITVRVIQPESGSVLFTEQQRFAGKDQFFGAMDALQKALRRDLGESNALIEKNSRPLAKVTTASLDALRFYSEAADYMAQGKMQFAPNLLQAALKSDPDFAMAHWLMARAYSVSGNGEKEVEELTRAYQLRSGVTDRERGLIEAAYYSAQEQYEKQAESLVALVGQYPDDGEARYQLALAYDSLGDRARAIEQARLVLKGNPYSSRAYGFLVMQLARNNQDAEAIEAYKEGVKLFPENPELKVGLGLARLGQGDVPAARAAFTQLSGGSYQWWGQVFLARAAMFEGKFNEARQILEAQLKSDLRDGNLTAVMLERFLLASTLLTQGKAAQSQAVVDAILAVDDPAALQAEDFRRSGALYAEAGETAKAGKALARLDKLRHDFSAAINTSCYYNLAGDIALAEGHPEAAGAAFRGALQARPRAISHIGIARSLEGLGNWAGAAEEWKQVAASRGELLYESTPLDWQVAYLQLGRAERKLNQPDAARNDMQKFLQLWQNADDVQLRTDALREFRQISGAGSTSANAR
jgi:tetratricopeptide (TPR) repeat protein